MALDRSLTAKDAKDAEAVAKSATPSEF